MSLIKFDSCFGEVSKERISFIEEEIGYRFPKNYIKNIARCDGGYPIDSIFDYYDKGYGRIVRSCLGCFLRLNEAQYDEFLKNYKNPPEFFPEGLVAFAEVGNGDLICFDYRQGKDNPDPPIVYWDHEAAGTGQDVSFIAKNFEEFMGMLRSDEDEE